VRDSNNDTFRSMTNQKQNRACFDLVIFINDLGSSVRRDNFVYRVAHPVRQRGSSLFEAPHLRGRCRTPKSRRTVFRPGANEMKARTNATITGILPPNFQRVLYLDYIVLSGSPTPTNHLKPNPHSCHYLVDKLRYRWHDSRIK